MRIRRRRLPARLALEVDGNPWLALKLPQERGVPKPVAEDAQSGSFPPASELKVQGDFKAREFELRWSGKLVALISWQTDEKEDGASENAYYVEILKTAPAAPLLEPKYAFML